jgi:putative DNA primase/helicase
VCGRSLLDTDGVQFPPIPVKPTKAEAERALALLKTPFEEFPFAIDEDFPPASPSRPGALSAVLTGLIRRTLPTAPLHGL